MRPTDLRARCGLPLRPRIATRGALVAAAWLMVPTVAAPTSEVVGERTEIAQVMRPDVNPRPGERAEDALTRTGVVSDCDLTRGKSLRFRVRRAERKVQFPADACMGGTVHSEYASGGGSGKHILIQWGDKTAAIAPDGRVSNADPRFDFLREALR